MIRYVLPWKTLSLTSVAFRPATDSKFIFGVAFEHICGSEPAFIGSGQPKKSNVFQAKESFHCVTIYWKNYDQSMAKE